VAALSARDSLDKTVPALKDYRETFGTTAAELKAHLNGDMRADPKGNHWCAQLVRTTVKVDWITTVYLARELEPGSCPLAAVQAHEAKHVALDRELLPMMKQDVETAVRGVTRAPVWGTSANEAMAALKARIEQAAKAAIDDFEKQRDARQLLIDTPEEYDRVSASCGKDAFSKLGIHASTEM